MWTNLCKIDRHTQCKQVKSAEKINEKFKKRENKIDKWKQKQKNVKISNHLCVSSELITNHTEKWHRFCLLDANGINARIFFAINKSSCSDNWSESERSNHLMGCCLH